MYEVGDILYTVVGTLLVSIFGILFGLTVKGIDRKLAAHMQWRVGPPIRQPFRDVRKLFCKENIIPKNAVPWLFNSAPIIALASAIVILLYIPMGSLPPILEGYGDLILILYLLLIPSLAIIMGGFASGSPFATVGAQREFILLLSYEFPFAVIIFTFAWKINLLYPKEPAFSLATFAQHPILNTMGPLGIIGAFVLLLILLLVTTGEISKIPFDIAEAETEIAGGALVEYSGKNLGMFYLADAVKSVVLSSLIVAIFFPYNLSPLLSSFIFIPVYLSYTIDFLFYLLKVIVVLFFAMTFIRVAVARFKVDQVVKVYWGNLAMVSIIGLILIALDTMGW